MDGRAPRAAVVRGFHRAVRLLGRLHYGEADGGLR